MKEDSQRKTDIWNVPKIDVHVHIGEEPGGDKFSPIQLYHDMKEFNVKKAVIFPFNTEPKDGFKEDNEMIHRLASKYESLIGFSRIDPTHEDWREEMERALELGMKGYKFHPHAQDFECDEIGSAYEKAIEFNMPMIIHSAHKEGKYVQQLKETLPSYPELVIILAHAGITEQSDAFKLVNEMENVYLEASINKKHRIEVLSMMVDDEKWMFGSDSPYGGIETTLERMDIDWKSEETVKKVFYENAERVLDI